MQVVLVIGLGICFIAAGLLMAYIAAIDIKTRLISSRVLFCLVLVRLAVALVSCLIDPVLLSEYFTGGETQFVIECFSNRGCSAVLGQEGRELEAVERGIFCLCTQLSFSSLSVSSVNSLIVVLFLQLLVFATDAIVLKSRGKKRQISKPYRGKSYGKNDFIACDMAVREADICEIISRERGNNTKKSSESFGALPSKNRTVNKSSKNTSLGLGDVLLVGVCCLYLASAQMEVFFLVVALGGIALAGLTYLIRRETTFPFAPVIVLGCMIAFLL